VLSCCHRERQCDLTSLFHQGRFNIPRGGNVTSWSNVHFSFCGLEDRSIIFHSKQRINIKFLCQEKYGFHMFSLKSIKPTRDCVSVLLKYITDTFKLEAYWNKSSNKHKFSQKKTRYFQNVHKYHFERQILPESRKILRFPRLLLCLFTKAQNHQPKPHFPIK
jgi:hypothetical protein